MVICPLQRENVPYISNPLPLSAGNQQNLDGVNIVGVADKPNISPNKPVVVGATLDVVSVEPPSYKKNVLFACDLQIFISFVVQIWLN